MNEDHYRVLGVGPSASGDEIRAAYRREARRLHPDSAGSASSSEMARLNEAYRVLSDPGRRVMYDRSRGPSPTSTHQRPTGSPQDAPMPQLRAKYSLGAIDRCDRKSPSLAENWISV